MSGLVEQLEAELPGSGMSSEQGGTGELRTGRKGGPVSLPRRRIVLSCAQCGSRNYRKTKARREGLNPLTLSKFCSICNAHTQHREAV